MSKGLSPELVAKWPQFIRQHSDGHYIADRVQAYSMPDEAYKELIGGVRIRKLQKGDGSPRYGCPETMQVWVSIDTEDNTVCDYILVDARLQLVVDATFSLTEIINLPPEKWSVTMRNRFPGAMPTKVYPAY